MILLTKLVGMLFWALHYRDLHTSGREEAWWQERHLDPLAVADQLWALSQRRLKQLS